MKFTFVLAIFALAGTAFAETNAERFRRGLGPLKPRHFGTQTTQVAQPCEFSRDEKAVNSADASRLQLGTLRPRP